MSRILRTTVLLGAIACVSGACRAQAQQQQQKAADENRSVSGGGIFVNGWQGVVDAGAAKSGQTVKDAKFVQDGKALHVTTGPAITYWNPANTASGDYTVKATFTEAKYMNLNDHPHPYGLFVGGRDLGTEQQSLLYCAAYGNGTYIVRGFGPAPFRVVARPEANEAVHKATGQGQPVTQEIAISVKGDNVSCAINGTVVGTWPKSAVVGDGKLKSTDGIYGVRFAHNTEGTVTGLSVSK